MTDQFDLARLMYEQPAAGTGMLSLADIDSLIDAMFAGAGAEPSHLYVSVEDARKIHHYTRIAALYRACPRPRRKIRKCHMRRLQTRWHQGRRYIRKIEQAEIAREEAEMRRVAKEQASE